MKSKRAVLWLIIILTSLLLACAVLPGTPTPVPTSTPEPTATNTQVPTPTNTPSPSPTPEPTATPTETPEPTETPLPEGASIEIINESGQDIWYVYISPSDAEDWGEDWLGDEVVLDGDTFTLWGIPEDIYDVRAEGEGENVIEVLWEVTVTGDNTWTVEGNASLEIFNESSEIIAGLYIAPSDSDEWGEDWLGDVAVKPDGSYLVTGIERDTYDLKVTDAEGDMIEGIYLVSLEGEHTWTVLGKGDLPESAVLRFEDEFSDNRNNWGRTGDTENVHYMRPADGEYCILMKAEQLTAWEWYEPFRTDEFVAELSCSLDPVGDASCGLGFGPDGDNLYWFEVSPADQSFALFVLKDDAWLDPLIEWTVSKNIIPDGANYLSLERVEGVVSVFVNGIRIGQVESDFFPTGRVGLGGSTYEEGDITVCLDNLRVWRIQ